VPNLLAALDAFMQEHRRCGDQDGREAIRQGEGIGGIAPKDTRAFVGVLVTIVGRLSRRRLPATEILATVSGNAFIHLDVGRRRRRRKLDHRGGHFMGLGHGGYLLSLGGTTLVG
jgi:hypothetical protein